MEKLVRDEMPYLCIKNKKIGWTPMNYRVAEEKEMPLLLANKLAEEALETKEAVINMASSAGRYHKEKLTEEIADLQEVILALQRKFGIGEDEVERVRRNKIAERGGFTKNIVWDGNK